MQLKFYWSSLQKKAFSFKFWDIGSSIQTVCVRDKQIDRRFPSFTEGDNSDPISKQPLDPWRHYCLNSTKTTALLPQQFVWLGIETKYTQISQLSFMINWETTHIVNRNILSNAPSGANSKGAIGWALAIVGLQRVWWITLPLSNKRLECSCTTTSRGWDCMNHTVKWAGKVYSLKIGSNTQSLKNLMYIQ